MPTLNATVDLVLKFKSEIVKLAKITSEEFDYFFKKSFNKYLDNQFDKLFYTKTFLFRDEKIPFYEAFFPVPISGSQLIDTSKVSSEIFEKSNFITIIGSAGSGKTMLMKHLFINSYTKLYRIPIIIELRHLNEFEGDITEYIYNVILESKVAPSKRILERILSSGMFLFLLDGYDEIYSEQKKHITHKLESFVDLYSNNFFMITSRPGADAEYLDRFDNMEVQSLGDEQIESFIKQQLKIIDDLELASKIISVISKAENSDYKSYLRNPLLLSMFILTFRQYPELPRSKNKFYWNVYDTLITKHDSFSKRGGFQHERKTGLQNEDIEKILQWFSYKSFFSGKYHFDKQYLVSVLLEIKEVLKLSYNIENLVYDLTVSTSLLIIDGLDYKFPHKTFQEYFCASLISGLDIESKRIVYSQSLEKYSTKADGISSFLDLCYELDKVNFLELLAIPKLKSFYSEIVDETHRKMAIKFCEITGYGPLIEIKDYGYKVDYWKTVNLYNDIISYFDVCDYDALFDDQKFKENFDYEYVLDLLSRRYLRLVEFEHVDNVYDLNIKRVAHELQEILDRMDFHNSVKGVLESVKLKIAELENELQNEKTKTQSLLAL